MNGRIEPPGRKQKFQRGDRVTVDGGTKEYVVRSLDENLGTWVAIEQVQMKQVSSNAAHFAAMSDTTLAGWHRFHTDRIARAEARIATHQRLHAEREQLTSDEYRAEQIDAERLTIRHSRRHLDDIESEQQRRGRRP